jgi:hypothetical protein
VEIAGVFSEATERTQFPGFSVFAADGIEGLPNAGKCWLRKCTPTYQVLEDSILTSCGKVTRKRSDIWKFRIRPLDRLGGFSLLG